jgi:hypothetical protein
MTEELGKEPKTRVDRLTEQLLADRARQAERQAKLRQEGQEKRAPSERDPIGFDSYQDTNWTALVGPDLRYLRYLPKTPMRPGAVGFYIHCKIHCKACNAEFESKGLAYCLACMELPAEERHAMKPAFSGRMCQAPGCENPIPRAARAGTRYCSKACRQRASYSTPNPPG